MSEFVPETLPAFPNGMKALNEKLDHMISECEMEVVIRRSLLLQQEAALAAMKAEAHRIKAKVSAAKE